MQERDSFQLTYSQSLHNSRPGLTKNPEDEEKQELSPNKQSLLQTLKQTMMKPLPSQEIISSLTSVERDKESLPCPNPQEESERSQNKHSLPLIKSIKKLASNSQEKHESSRIKIEAPRTISQKASLSKKIDDATDFLAHGIEVQKYCFGINKIQHVVLFFSEEMSFMGLYHIVKQRPLIISMQQCMGISVGAKTQRFQSYKDSQYTIPEDRSFSIIFQDRTFDFVVKTHEHRNRIVKDVEFLRGCLQLKNC